jgi:hypothetical protein
MKLLSLMLIPLIALAIPAFAQSAPDPSDEPSSSDQAYDAGPAPEAPAPAQPHRARQNRFVAADSNGDGRLSRAEAQAIPFVAKHFDAIDSDRDGYITRAELRAERQRMQAARAQRAAASSGS